MKILFFKREYGPSIIHEYDLMELKKFLKDNQIYLEINDQPSLWAGFSQWFGRTHGLNELESASFSSIVSTFLSGLCVSCGTEMYFYEERIENRVIDYYNSQNFENEKEQVKDLFYFIFNIYKNEIHKYEIQNSRLEFRVSQNFLNRFNQVNGDSKKEKLLNLVDYYFK